MKRAFAWALVTLAIGCGGEAASSAPPQTAADAAPVEAAPADAAPADSAATKPADDGEAWSGEAEAKTEKAPAGDAKGADTRTMDIIAQTVKDNRPKARECVDKAKKDLPDLKGDMVINFIIDPEGKVKKAELNQERSSLKAPPVVDCVINVVKAIKFPPSSRGMDSTVNYPFNFK